MTKRQRVCEKMRLFALMFTVTFVIYGWASFADFAGAKSGVKWRDISGAGATLWVFLILGAIIILLQLVPAIIMFFSLLGGAYKSVPDKEVVDEVPEVQKGS